MSDKKFRAGDKVQNLKTKQVGFLKKQRGEGVYLVSIPGVGEREWKDADIEMSTEPKSKRNHNWNKSA